MVFCIICIPRIRTRKRVVRAQPGYVYEVRRAPCPSKCSTNAPKSKPTTSFSTSTSTNGISASCFINTPKESRFRSISIGASTTVHQTLNLCFKFCK
uniref:Uncharacterized protein n=1 Tax=Panagrolaimus superbus TaxID=310955 RepID=A0A914YBV6_9BILA